MKYLFLLFSLCSFLLYSQQELEICGDDNTVTYSTTIDISGTVEWFLNGNPYSEGLSMDVSYTEPGDYEIVAIGYNDLGCPGTPVVLYVTVTQCDPLIYWIPNTFTPDGNEYNQTWGPVLTSGISVDQYELTIYNRWGVVIWQTHDMNARWDGTYNGVMVPDGTYTWELFIHNLNNDGKQKVAGHVTVLK
jgi:trimeric autotransporter adhesin